jgi:signal transduction histidine kinase
MRRSVLESLYQRYPSRYLPLCVLIVWAFSLTMCALITLLLAALYLQLDAHEIRVTLVLAELGTVGGLGLALIVVARRTGLPLLRWASGEDRSPEAAAEAWVAGTRATFMWPAIAALGCTVLTLPAEIYFLGVAPVPAWQIILVVGPVVQFGIVATSILAYFCGEAFVRPIVAEISRELPRDFEPEGWVPKLRARLIPTVLVVDIFASILAGGLVSRASGPTEALLFSLLAGLLINLTFSLTWTLALSNSILGPVRNLLGAAKSVQEGDLSTRVPLVSNDELTDLSKGFNEMIDGLEERESLREHNVELVEELRASRARIVAAADAERQAVERDLHDGAQQRLVLLNLKLGLVEQKLRTEPAAAAEAMADAKGELELALNELRDLAHGIYPQVLLSDGLPGALAEAAERSPIAAAASLGACGRHAPELEAAVYFCCLEALQNAAKYAGANAHATVSVADSDGTLRFEVADDGAGFDATSVNGSNGLQNMTDRVGALGGELRIESEPGGGTRIRGAVPLAP